MINGIFLVLLFGGWLAAGLLIARETKSGAAGTAVCRVAIISRRGPRFAALFDNAPMACALLDIDFRIMEWNRQAEVLFGLKLEDAMGHNMIEIMVPSDENEKARDEMAAFFASGKIFLFTSPKLADTGKTVDMELQTAVLRDCEEKPYGILAMATGITQSKATENELRIQGAVLACPAGPLLHGLAQGHGKPFPCCEPALCPRHHRTQDD